MSSRLARLCMALVLVVLCAALAAPIASAANAFAIGGSSSSGVVVPINLATNVAGTPLNLGETPNDLTVSPDGKTAYVAIGDSFNAGKIIVLDTETATKKSEITGTDLTQPMNAVVSPDGKTLYVIKKKGVVPVNLETLAHGAEMTLPAESEKGGAAISADGSTLWVSVGRGLVRINTALSTVSPTITDTGSSGNDVEVSPDGKTVYTAGYSSAVVGRVDVATGTALSNLTTTASARAIELSPDGTKLYIGENGSGNAGTFGTYDLAGGSALPDLAIGANTGPIGLAVNNTGTTAYLADLNTKAISVIDLGSDAITGTIALPTNPTRIVIGAPAVVEDPNSKAAVPTISTTLPTQAGEIGDPTNPTLGVNVAQLDAAETPVPSRELKLSFSSSNTAVLPVSGISVSGEGGLRTLSFAPTGRGTTEVTVTVTGVGKKQASTTFKYSASMATTPTSRYLQGFSDSSTAIGLGNGLIIVAEDERDLPGLFREGVSGPPLKTYDIGFAPNPGADEMDFESSARAGDVIYWLGSHGNNSDGAVSPTRSAVIATRVSGSGDQTELTRIGAYGGLREELIAWDNEHGARLGFEKDAALGSPNGLAGFNIEGAEFAPNSTSTLYLGFRAPIEPSVLGGKALIVPVENIDRLTLGIDSKAEFGEPIYLDLGGRSIRELRKNASGQYLILASYDHEGAGPNDAALYSWTGYREDAPVELTTTLPVSPEEHSASDGPGAWEGIGNVPDVLTAGSQIRLIMDEGWEKLYGDDVKDKGENDPQRKKSRTDVFTLTGNVGAAIGATTPSFAAQAVGTTGPGQWVTITDTGSQKLVIGELSVVGDDEASAGDFLIGQDECHGRTLGLGGSCRVLVRFSPAREGVISKAHLAIDANVLGGEADVPLSATSTALSGGAGEKGPTGDKGPSGDAGPKGPTGNQGAGGPAGPAGPKGESGEVTFRISFDSGTVQASTASRKVRIGTELLSAPAQGGSLHGRLTTKWNGKNLELAHGLVTIDRTGHMTLLLTKRPKPFAKLAAAGETTFQATLKLVFRPLHKTQPPVTAEKTVTVRLAG